MRWLQICVHLQLSCRDEAVCHPRENKECQDCPEDTEEQDVANVIKEAFPSHVEARGEYNWRQAHIEEDLYYS